MAVVGKIMLCHWVGRYKKGENMTTITDGNYVASPIPNTTMLEKLRDGELYGYEIRVMGGYVLHDKAKDAVLEGVEIFNQETGELETVNKTVPGFASGSLTCESNYDFIENPRELYTIFRAEAPEDAVIF